MKKKKKPITDKSIFTQSDKNDFITVKTSLKSILKDYDTNFLIINDSVNECNDIVIRTYQFTLYFISYCTNRCCYN